MISHKSKPNCCKIWFLTFDNEDEFKEFLENPEVKEDARKIV